MDRLWHEGCYNLFLIKSGNLQNKNQDRIKTLAKRIVLLHQGALVFQDYINPISGMDLFVSRRIINLFHGISAHEKTLEDVI